MFNFILIVFIGARQKKRNKLNSNRSRSKTEAGQSPKAYSGKRTQQKHRKIKNNNTQIFIYFKHMTETFHLSV